MYWFDFVAFMVIGVLTLAFIYTRTYRPWAKNPYHYYDGLYYKGKRLGRGGGYIIDGEYVIIDEQFTYRVKKSGKMLIVTTNTKFGINESYAECYSWGDVAQYIRSNEGCFVD